MAGFKALLRLLFASHVASVALAVDAAAGLLQLGEQVRGSPLAALMLQGGSSRGLAQMADNLAAQMKRNYTLSDEDHDALNTIESFVDQMVNLSNVSHEHDQEAINASYELILKCREHPHNASKRYNGTMQEVSDTLKKCREEEDDLNDTAPEACPAYNTYRKTNTSAHPPACMPDDVTATMVATDDTDDLAKMETCLENMHAWIVPLWRKYSLCEQVHDDLEDKLAECSGHDSNLSHVFCKLRQELTDSCHDQDECRDLTITARNRLHDTIHGSRVTVRSGYQIKCLFKVLRAHVDNKEALIQHCLDEEFHLNAVTYHPIPDAEPCLQVPEDVCDTQYVIPAMRVKNCGPCPTVSA